MSFDEKCYELLKKIPKGRVTTYKEIALALNTKAYQAVGSAMARNPNAPEVPCHRVVNSDGKIGNYQLGVHRKIAILKSEGVEVAGGVVDDFNEKLFSFR